LAPLPVRPALEALEDRTTPTTIAWVNRAGGLWDVAANWDLFRTPQPSDDVVIRNLDFGSVIDHASGDDTVQSITSLVSDATLAVTHLSSLTVTGSVDNTNLTADTGGVLTANNTGDLTNDLRAQGGGEVHLPSLTGYHVSPSGTPFRRIEADGEGSLIDLPAVTSLLAYVGGPGRGVGARLDLVADAGGTINLPALTSVRGRPEDVTIGFTHLRASDGGTFDLDTGGTLTLAAGGSLEVGAGATVQAGQIVVNDSGQGLTVDGGLTASAVLVGGGNVTVSGSLEVSGGYTMTGGMTELQGGSVTVGDLFDIQVGYLFGSGAITGDVRNAALLDVGSLLTVDGNFTQVGSGQVSFGLRSASEFSQLVVTGSASLDGTLKATFVGAYRPQRGDQFQVIQFGAGTGTFAHLIVDAPRFGVFYVFQPNDVDTPGVTLLF
jgi:hypothetical protein